MGRELTRARARKRCPGRPRSRVPRPGCSPLRRPCARWAGSVTLLRVFQRGRPTVPGGDSGKISVINGTIGDKTRNKQAHGVIWGSQFRLTGLGQLSVMPTLAHRKVQPSRWRLFPRPVTWTWPEPHGEKLRTEPEGDCFIPTAGGDELRVKGTR